MDVTRAQIRTAKARDRAERRAKSIAEKTGVDASVLRVRHRDPVVRGVWREEALADFLKDLDDALGDDGQRKAEPSATAVTPAFLSDEQRASLEKAGYHSDEDVLAATDEQLVALKAIGTTTVEKYRAEFA